MFSGDSEAPANPYYGLEKQATAAMMAMDRNPTVTERLKRQKAELEFRLNEINEVLGALESNPEIQKVVDAVSKIRGI